MTPLLTELLLANLHDENFVHRMQALSECNATTDAERAWKLLDETPACLRTSGLFLLNQGLLYHGEKDYERALPNWKELRRLWPQDAAGFGNAITALQELGRNDEARKLLAEVPACYRRFFLYWRQRAELHCPPHRFPPHIVVRFRGRPDLHGLLIPDCGFEPDAEQKDTL